ncbi:MULTISPECIES: lanthionine synthetase LanC family protein [unclassified Streptococcus]|uniref:lanthionine synthetase LanC family protein n=1 Tax=unclassified Streptococcus TaxID=2608887 RepID=UPI00359D0D4E
MLSTFISVQNYRFYKIFYKYIKGINSSFKVFSPYLYDGIAGVGYTCLRLYQTTKKEFYYTQLINIISASLFELTSFVTYMRGMAGIVDFLLDCLFVIKDSNLKNKILYKIEKLIDSMSLYFDDEQGLFLGEQLFKLSADLVSGTSGILLVMKRYMNYKNDGVLTVSHFINLDEETKLFEGEIY